MKPPATRHALRRPILRTAPVLAGLLAAPLVACLGIFGFGDAAAMARLALEREAEFASEALLARWPGPSEPLILAGGEVVASGAMEAARPWQNSAEQRPAEQNAPVGSPAGSSIGSSIGPTAHLHRLAALDAAARGDRDLALSQLALAEEVAQGPDKQGPGLGPLARVHVLLELGDGQAICDFWPPTEALGATTFQPGPRGVPVRLAAFLAAAAHLSVDQRAAEASAIRAAIESGRMPLAAPGDTFDVGPEIRSDTEGSEAEPHFQPDPFWTALEELCAERAPGPDWKAAFLVEPRRQAAAARWASAELDHGERLWQIRPLSPGAWLSVTQDPGGGWLARRHSAECLDAELSRLVPGLPRTLPGTLSETLPGNLPEGSRVAAFTSAPDAQAISSPKPLPGLDRELRIVHSDPGSIARAATLRQRTLRAGLVGAGILMALAALLTWRALGEADRVASLRTTFVASVSHDLRTPIASIGLMAETLRDGHATGREDHYARSIEQEAGRLRRIVDDLLDFGRLERGLPVRLAKRDVELAPWLETFVARERERCRTFGGAALALQTHHLPAAAILDVEAVERALSNLIDNALKHSGADRIALSVRASETSREELVFEVADGGTGLSKGILHEDLFEPFARDSATSGTGLGLSIVRAIAVAHGGDASLSPGTDGRGLVARVTIRTTKDAA